MIDADKKQANNEVRLYKKVSNRKPINQPISAEQCCFMIAR